MFDSRSDLGSWYTYMAACCDFDDNIYPFSLDAFVRHTIKGHASWAEIVQHSIWMQHVEIEELV
jgi:hypothetical protein